MSTRCFPTRTYSSKCAHWASSPPRKVPSSSRTKSAPMRRNTASSFGARARLPTSRLDRGERPLRRKRRVVLPRALDDAGRELVAHAFGLFARERADARGVATGCRKHAQLKLGALFQETRRDRRRAHVGRGRSDAVTAHHDRDAIAEVRRQQIAQLARADEADAIELGDAAPEHAPVIVHDAVRLPDLG